MAYDSSTLPTEKLDLPMLNTSDQSKTQYITLTNQSSSLQDQKMSLPKEREDSGLAKSSSVTPDSPHQAESPDVLTIMSPESMSSSPGSGFPQLDQLLSDVEDMQPTSRPVTLDLPLSEFSSEAEQISEFEDLEEQCLSVSPVVQLSDDNKTSVAFSEPEHFQASIQVESEAVSANNDATKISETSVPSSLDIHKYSQCQGGHKTSTPFEDSESVTEETPLQSIQEQHLHSQEATSIKTIQNEDFSSQSLSDLTPETVTTARCFSFDEPVLDPSSENLLTSDKSGPRTSGELSEKSLTPVDYECFPSQSPSVKLKTELTSSASDEEYCIPPGYAEVSSISTHKPPGYAEVMHRGADSPIFEYSDSEPFFDCKQGASDFSETEPDEPGTRSESNKGPSQDHIGRPNVPEKMNRRVLLSSGSEDYEEASFVQEPLYQLQEESDEHYSDASDEEFSLCEASQLPPVRQIEACDDTDKSLTREIIAELGSLSESSDDEILTTRIVRRRVFIQADEMPDLPSQSVTEEKYKDENGHIVVKKVTRTVIRKCVSADGTEMPPEGGSQGSFAIAEGDGYSKVVKRTVVKSEGDDTEVTFAECEGFSSSTQEKVDGRKVSQTERTTVVEGERIVTHHGDPSLASDLPSAQDDFKQALGYLSVISGTELPHVVESETVKGDGTVVRRAHVRKDRTLRRTVVKGAGQHKRVLLEKMDSPRKGLKPPGLQQHLHQLFHRYYEEEKEDDDEDEEEEEEE